MNSLPHSSGIYVILNTKNQKVYIGKTAAGFNGRWKDHKKTLNAGRHHNSHLQAAWNKYGAKTFRFFKLEYCPIDKLNEREKHHIAIYKARGLAYNQTDGGDGQSGNSPSLETRAKLSAMNKGKKLPPFSEEHRQRLSEANKGKVRTDEMRKHQSLMKKGWVQNSEARARGVITRSQNWIVTTPDGEIYEIKNLKGFCREHGLDSSSMIKVAQGKLKQTKGWKCCRA